MLNSSEELTIEDERLFEAVSGMDTIVVINKTDLPQKIDLQKLRNLPEQENCYDIPFER